ncbi:hypothetical protein [Kitasatospora sp. DSM 101779]|uniref:hypothetical protein n=1 Tax=Kitasatospora sp. DSM 101779 TaxID=2853165 RepID=UPI0021D9856A|nr:hypothetical protein [Kitasatospora sp. DSM 101779]MCU7821392.1 hypothetical protein [Kitasatospora sp. DSM 101779]
MTIHLVGGGRDEAWYAELYGPFLAEAGTEPEVACLLLDEGDVPEQFERWSGALAAAAPCRPRAVPVVPGAVFDPAVLDGADAVFVGGGLTPEYASALAGPLGRRLAERPLPYAGFSAGAAIAAGRAVVGGWLSEGVPVCPEETAEDLDEIEVRDGLGLIAPAVDVHAAQWGTLGRLVEAVARGVVPYGLAIDENTALAVHGTTARVRGAGRVHLVRPDGGGAAVRSYRAGEDLPL